MAAATTIIPTRSCAAATVSCRSIFTCRDVRPPRKRSCMACCCSRKRYVAQRQLSAEKCTVIGNNPQTGMDDYIAKPVTLDRLAPALAKCRPLAAATAPAVAPPVEKQRIAGTALDRDVLDQLREDLGGTAALREVIRSFLDHTPSVLSALRDAAARADVPSIRRAAHMIKGTSSI